jgi:ankyrin repeat protein
MVACWNGHLDTILILLNEGKVDPNRANKNGNILFYGACRSDRLDVVKGMLDWEGSEGQKVNINQVNDYGSSAFLGCCAFEKLEAIKLLLDYETDERVDINQTDGHKSTGFCIACARGYSEIAKFLIERGANPLLKDTDGDAALHNAAFGGDESTIEFLISLRLNPFECNNSFQTPRSIAIKENKIGAAMLLEQYEADFKARYGCNTALGCQDWEEYQQTLDQI